MSLFLSCLEISFYIFVVLVEYYIIYSFIRSKMGKYPPYVPTRKEMVQEIVKEISPFLENASSAMNITEPGCGDARIIAALAKKFPQHSFTGYEWDVVPYFLAKITTKKYKNIRVVRQNFMTADYTKENFVILFTGDEIAAELSKKLSADLPDDALILSQSFKVPEMTCIKEIETAKKNYFFLPPKLYWYKKSGKKENQAV